MANFTYQGRISEAATPIVRTTRTFTNGNDLVAFMRNTVKSQMKQAIGHSLNLLGQTMGEELKDAAGSEGNPANLTALMPSTVEWKTKNQLGRDGRPDSIGYATGDWLDDLDYSVNQGQKTVKIGSNLDYIWYFEYGRAGQAPRPIFSRIAKTKVEPKVMPMLEKIMLRAIDS